MINFVTKRIDVSKLPNNSWDRNSRARREIFHSFLSNNPSFALLNAWSELENDVRFYKVMKKSKITSDIVIKECTRVTNLSADDKNRLISISQMRNGVAHALPNRKKPSWSDVIFVLRIAKKYRRMKI